ncbi:hypothetical protein BCON_0249g00070 [Botryotinia convoluta]|uniref:Cytochrome P450 n=1 Tax=Botryotinia convoluta TaxID=54673 RepID=A0A4Z1HGQ1_9HELO|nr:hypothetical protein BCON_0249g00070 [Botryotinia convoluta]
MDPLLDIGGSKVRRRINQKCGSTGLSWTGWCGVEVDVWSSIHKWQNNNYVARRLSSKLSYTISFIKISPALVDKSKDTMPSTLVLGASAVLLFAYIIRAILFRPKNSDFPIVGNPNDADFRAALLEGTAKKDVVLAREGVAKYIAWLRSFAIPFLPEIRKVKQYKVVRAELLRPVIEGCFQIFREGKGGDEGDEFNDNQGTFFIAPLREEIDQVLADDGWEDDGSGIKNLKKQSLPKLKELDSLLKEGQRRWPLDLVFNIRSTTSPIRLSTSETIPTGTRITFDAHTINMSGPNVSSLPHDPSSIPALDPPEIFSPFRWSTLRESPGNESKYQYVTTGKESVNFEHGNHACPGRFFAATEIKVLMVEILKGWDFRLVGDKEGKRGERPGNYIYNVTISPNPAAELEFKRRVV